MRTNQNAMRTLRNTTTPLTMDQIRNFAPSVFATEAYEQMSRHYVYIPTFKVLEAMMEAGFMPFAVSQSFTKNVGKKDFTKHMIRFRSQNKLGNIVGDVFPEIVLLNGHDGSTAWKLMAGLFRLVCTNGMIIEDGMVESFNVRHSTNAIELVTAGSVEIVEHMPRVIDAVARWKAIQLDMTEQRLLATAAHTVRFEDSEGHVNTPILPEQLLQIRRTEDNGNDLWSVFNRIQENTVKGGLHGYRGSRRVSTRNIRGINQDVTLNKALWALAANMAKLKTNQ